MRLATMAQSALLVSPEEADGSGFSSMKTRSHRLEDLADLSRWGFAAHPRK